MGIILPSVQFSCSVMSNSLQPHGLQHTRPHCPSPTPGAYPNSCPSSRWCHPTISSSVVPFSPCLPFFPASGSFQMSQFFTSSPKYWSFSFNISPSNEYSGLISFKMDWLDLLAVQGTLRSLLQHHSSKASILWHSSFFIVQLSHPYMTTGKTIALTRRTFVGKVMSLLFNTLSRLVINFLPRSKFFLISWLQSPSAVILEPHLPPPPQIFCHQITQYLRLPLWLSGKESTAVEETLVPSLGWEDPLEKEMATHSRILAWRIPRTEEPGKGPQSMGFQKSWTRLSDRAHMQKADPPSFTHI